MSTVQRVFLDGTWHFEGFPTSADEPDGAEISRPGYRLSGWNEAVVPGVVHLDLMRNDVLSDPFLGMSEKEAAWVEERDWWYRTEFPVGEELLRSGAVLLRCEGLDTFASLWLNGSKLGSTDNMFIPWEFPVKNLLVPGSNVLCIKFSSPTAVLDRLEKEKGKLAAAFYSARAYGRKAQYSFGWDWGPHLPTSGIWKPISLVAYRDAIIRNVNVTTSLDGDQGATFQIEAEVESLIDSDVQVSVKVECEEQEHSSGVEKNLAQGKNVLSVACSVPHAKLWWPAGYGEQPLYTVRLAVSKAEELLDETVRVTGVREIELLQERDLEGESFMFKINGVPIFFKGANWIPADNFLPRVSVEHYTRLVEMAAEANMNMLRVWGGGVYESEEFYSLCDRKGIAIWQDFMLSCAEYPEEEWFQQKVKQEAEVVVKELRTHPSIMLWCGNNENDWGFEEGLWGMRRDVFLGRTLYHTVLPEVCAKLDPSRPYWPSSPFGGANPNSQNVGDRHSWQACLAKIEDRPGPRWDDGRFISEFGVHSPPVLRSIRDFAGDEDDFLSPVMRHHNKAGEKSMDDFLRLISHYFPKPSGMAETVEYGQVCQSELLREAIEHWRRRKFNTSGVLIWQINDCWPAISWSLIDYWHRPKAAYYMVRRAFAPVLLSLFHQEQQIQIWLVNDTNKPVSGTVRLTLFDFDGTSFQAKSVPATAPPHSSVLVGTKALQELGFLDPTRHFIHARLAERGRKTVETAFLLSRFREITFPPARVTWEARRIDEQTFEVDVACRTFAKAVCLEARIAEDFSDNYFDLIPSMKKTVVVTVRRPTRLEDFVAGLKVSNGIFA